jgi:hypothetical protein
MFFVLLFLIFMILLSCLFTWMIQYDPSIENPDYTINIYILLVTFLFIAAWPIKLLVDFLISL